MHADALAVLEALPDAFYVLDDDFRYTYVSERALAYYNLTREAVLGKVIWDVFPMVVGSPLQTEIQRAKREGCIVTTELVSPFSGRMVAVRVCPVPDGLVVSFNDVTDRRTAEERDSFLLRLSALLIALDDALRPLYDAGAITLTAATMAGKHLAVNRCAYADVEADQDTFNLTGDYNDGVDSIVGRYRFRDFGEACLRQMRAGEPYIVTDSETDPRTQAVIESYRATKIRSVICVPLIKGGRFVAAMAVHQTTVREWIDEEVELLLAVASRSWESIERARVERMLRQRDEEAQRAIAEHRVNAERGAREEAERVSRMKDEFLATLSHELRTPLNAILGWSQLLYRDDSASTRVLEGLAVIERNARVQVQLIEDLLDMNRIISGKLRVEVQRVDLAKVIQSAIDTVRPAADARGVRLEAVLDTSIGPVRGDPSRLQQVFWNLVHNGIKFTPRGGKVQVVLERVNSHVEVIVTDTGAGISNDFLPYVFERFRQADASTTRAHGGLGLGLSIVKELVELHGGSVQASSAGAGKGATFVVRLPFMALHIGDAPVPQPVSVIEDAPVDNGQLLAGLSVLIVDDEADASELIKRLLEGSGATALVASSAHEGVAIVEHKRPNVLLSDIGMPGRDGYEFIRDVRALGPERGGRTPAAALTAFARSEDRQRALLAGYQSHIAKPVEPPELIAVVASLAGRIGRAL